jgi:hypothetical protein
MQQERRLYEFYPKLIIVLNATHVPKKTALGQIYYTSIKLRPSIKWYHQFILKNSVAYMAANGRKSVFSLYFRWLVCNLCRPSDRRFLAK